jgi:hypothetical protein
MFYTYLFTLRQIFMHIDKYYIIVEANRKKVSVFIQKKQQLLANRLHRKESEQKKVT